MQTWQGRIVKQPRLLDRVREQIRVRHYSLRTEQTYILWIRRFMLFHDKRHPREMGDTAISAFLPHLAVTWRCRLQRRIRSCRQFCFSIERCSTGSWMAARRCSRQASAALARYSDQALGCLITGQEAGHQWHCCPGIAWHRHAADGMPAVACQGQRF